MRRRDGRWRLVGLHARSLHAQNSRRSLMGPDSLMWLAALLLVLILSSQRRCRRPQKVSQHTSHCGGCTGRAGAACTGTAGRTGGQGLLCCVDEEAGGALAVGRWNSACTAAGKALACCWLLLLRILHTVLSCHAQLTPPSPALEQCNLLTLHMLSDAKWKGRCCISYPLGRLLPRGRAHGQQLLLHLPGTLQLLPHLHHDTLISLGSQHMNTEHIHSASYDSACSISKACALRKPRNRGSKTQQS